MYRVGMGYDIHRFTEGRKLVLGGVCIDHFAGLDGHSDADVVIHAIMDALLGAAGKDDIGHLFPNTDPVFKNISSVELLRHVHALIAQEWIVVNIDTVVIAERPKIAPYITEMKIIVSEVLNIEPSAVGVKATTNETLGALGRCEGIAALANVLLQRRCA